MEKLEVEYPMQILITLQLLNKNIYCINSRDDSQL